jgi:hypothetical protein
MTPCFNKVRMSFILSLHFLIMLTSQLQQNRQELMLPAAARISWGNLAQARVDFEN